MKYDNSLERVNDFSTPSGNRFAPIYSSKVMKDGSVELIESGKKDLRQEINSWRDHTDMAYILRAMAAGTYPQREGAMYGDFTTVPGSMVETMQLFLDAEKAFFDLDLDIRNKFDNDYHKWLVMANTDQVKFSDLMGFRKETPAEAQSEGEIVDVS